MERSLKDVSILSRTGPYAKLNRSLDFSRFSDDSRKEVASRSVHKVDSASELLNRSLVPPLKPDSESHHVEDAALVSDDSNQEQNSGADPTSPTDSQKSPASVLPSPDLSSPIKDSKQDNRHQLPALFSGIRVLKKGALGDERDTLSEIKQRDSDRSLLSLNQHVNKAKLQQAKKKTQVRSLSEITGLLQKVQQNEDKSHSPDPSADSSFDAVKSRLFSSKPVKKDPVEAALDLDAVRRKKKNDKDLLRSIFERQLSKALVADSKSPTEEEVCVTDDSSTRSFFI